MEFQNWNILIICELRKGTAPPSAFGLKKEIYFIILGCIWFNRGEEDVRDFNIGEMREGKEENFNRKK